MAKKAAGTPATVLLTAQQVAHELHPYEVSPEAQNYGALVAVDRMYVSAGRRGVQVSLAPADLIRLTGAATARIRA